MAILRAHVTRDDFRWDPTASPPWSRARQYLALSMGLAHLMNPHRQLGQSEEIRAMVVTLMEYGHA